MATLLFVDFSKALDSINRREMEQILPGYGLSKETLTAILMLYKSTKAMVLSFDGITDFFDIVVGVVQLLTLALYLLIIYWDDVLQRSLDLIKENGFMLRKASNTISCGNYNRRRLYWWSSVSC